MEIINHICFRLEEEPRLIALLENNRIRYKKGENISTVDISDKNPQWPIIQEYVAERNLFCLSETVFTEAERSAAEWLTLRSTWRCGYPQPEASFKYEQVTYNTDAHCNECGNGLVQNNDFQIKKIPNWGARHFTMLNWVEDELFLDDAAKTILCQTGLTGFQFRQVRNRTGKEIVPNINQLFVMEQLSGGLVPEEPMVDKVETCKVCGCVRYHTRGIGMLKYRKEVFCSAPDIVKTSESFGWGHSSSSLIIVSQRTYQTIVNHRIGRGLEFEPLELI